MEAARWQKSDQKTRKKNLDKEMWTANFRYNAQEDEGGN